MSQNAMTKRVTFYHKDTGLIHSTWSGPENLLGANTPQDHLAYVGHLDRHAQRVDVQMHRQHRETIQDLEGQLALLSTSNQRRADLQAQITRLESQCVVDYRPPQPSSDHEWNASAKRYELAEAPQMRRAALAQIAALEASQARPVRELVRDPTNAEARKRLDAIEGQIAALRVQL